MANKKLKLLEVFLPNILGGKGCKEGTVSLTSYCEGKIELLSYQNEHEQCVLIFMALQAQPKDLQASTANLYSTEAKSFSDVA